MQVTYSTVDCAVVDAAVISDACAALTAKTVAAYPSLAVIGCTGQRGSLVLVAANPAAVAIALVTTSGTTVGLTPSAFVLEAASATTVTAALHRVAAASTVLAATPAKRQKVNKVPKGKKDTAKGTKGKKDTTKGKKDTKGKGQGKGHGPKVGKAGLEEPQPTPAAADPAWCGQYDGCDQGATKTRLALVLGVLGVIGVAVGFRTREARGPESHIFPESHVFAEPMEKSPVIASRPECQHEPGTNGSCRKLKVDPAVPA